MRRQPLVRSITAVLVFCSFTTIGHASDWLQFGYDQAHSGLNSAEFSVPVPSQTTPQWSQSIHAVGSTTALPSDAAPVYLSDVTTASGTKDVLYVDTTSGTLVALDAATGTVIWSKQPSTDQTREGMSGSPAIDPNRQFVYAYALDGKVHKYKVGDGTEITGSGWPETSTVKPDVEKGASALAFSTPPGDTNYLYHVTNGYDGDGGDYQGHITTINLSTGAQSVFNVMCSTQTVPSDGHFMENGTSSNDCVLNHGRDGQMGGIWGRPGTIYDGQTNRIYVATANGLFDANSGTGNHNWGDSVLALNPNGTGSSFGIPLDSYTPANYTDLYNGDTDLGSTAPAILPSTSTTFPHLAVQSGKDSCVRLINLDRMGTAAGPAHPGGELNASTSCSTDALGTHVVFPQPAVWVNPADNTTWVYVVNHSDAIQAYQLNVSGTPSLTKKWSGAAGRSPVIGGHTLYYISGSAVVGLDTLTGKQSWSASISGVHWQSPIVVNHHLYVTDSSGTLKSFYLDGIFINNFE
jgi:outer membrane protein assembly factor BamB